MDRTLRLLQNPFRNLSRKQKFLFAARVGLPLMAGLLMVILVASDSRPQTWYVLRIDSNHVDVVLGIYNLLRNTITLLVIDNGIYNNLLPVDLGLSDLEIILLTDYALQSVAGLPQYFLLGLAQWCNVSYQTDSSGQRIGAAPKRVCQSYGSFSFFDFRSLLMDNDLQLMLAYAYGLNSESLPAYLSLVHSRTRHAKVARVMFFVLMVLQLLVFVATLLAYANRGQGKDLSHIPKLTLNGIGVLALASAALALYSIATLTALLVNMRSDVEDGLGSYGISMSLAVLFFAVVFVALALNVLAAFSWIIPLWCSNPEQNPAEHEVLVSIAESRVSRLFDPIDTPRSLLLLAYPAQPHMPSQSEPHSEQELRQLGERMARSATIRQLASKQRTEPLAKQGSLHRKETHEILYSNPISNHQYPQAYPQKEVPKELQKEYLILRAASLTDRPLDRPMILPFEVHRHGAELLDDAHLFLDDDEVQYLDNNRFVNKLV